jgi:hypothetical protein
LPDVSDEGFTVHACGKGSDNAGIRDVLELVLALCKAFDVITEVLAGLVFASVEVPRGA